MRLYKALGQNFFNNPNLADWIVETALASSPKTVVEVGPGDGYFTSRFLGKTDNVVVIEKDVQLSEFLKVKLPKVTIYNEDVLDFKPEELDRYDKPIVMYGSLPYNISKKIIAKFVKYPNINDFYFIIQREVAEKYAQSDDKSSLLSITGSIFVDTKILKILKPGNFIPAPKVESALIHMHRNNNIEKIKDLKSFETFVKVAFTRPRKTLRNNLKQYLQSGNRLQEDDVLTRRPENLELLEYINLYTQLMI